MKIIDMESKNPAAFFTRCRSLGLTSLIFTCAVFAMTPVFAQTLSYAGKVTDASGAGIAGAIVRVTGDTIKAVAGTDGSFVLNGVITGIAPRPSEPSTTIDFGLDGWSGNIFRADGSMAVSLAFASAGYFFSRPDNGDALATTHAMNKVRLRKYASSMQGAAAAQTALAAQGAASSPGAAATFSLSAFKIGYLTGTFPQSAATATGLTLSLTKSTDTATYAVEKKLCMDTINAYRAKVGVPAVAWSKNLETFADEGARYDSEFGVAHGHFKFFVKNASPADAENALPGWPLKNYKNVGTIVAKGTEQMWGEGPGGGHYENIKGSHTVVGCGIYITPAGNVWLIQDFK